MQLRRVVDIVFCFQRAAGRCEAAETDIELASQQIG